MPRLPNADARRGARARPSALKGKRSLTPAMPGEDNVPDLSFDEETVVSSHSFCSDFQGMHLRESSSIRAPSGQLAGLGG